MPKPTLDVAVELAPIRAHLAERLAGLGLSLAADSLLQRAAQADSPAVLARDLGLSHPQPAALAMMIARADAGRLEDALALSPFGIEPRPAPVARDFLVALERNACRPSGPLLDADGKPIVFVVSYPRSGNTRFLNIMAGAFPGSRFTAFVYEGRYVSAGGWGVAFRSPVFVKDHALQDAYRQNPVVYLARDGRDCCLSYNDFKLRRSDADATAIAEGADSLARILDGGNAGLAFGDWPAHINRALAWQAEGAAITILNYDTMMGEDAFEAVAGALAAAGVTLTAERYAVGLQNAADREAALRSANPSWGRARIYPAGSMMDRWLDTPGASKWRALVGPDDKARLHAAGFTEPLVRAGFEEDPLWWQT